MRILLQLIDVANPTISTRCFSNQQLLPLPNGADLGCQFPFANAKTTTHIISYELQPRFVLKVWEPARLNNQTAARFPSSKEFLPVALGLLIQLHFTLCYLSLQAVSSAFGALGGQLDY